MIKKITIALLILIACSTPGQSFSQLQTIKIKPGQYDSQGRQRPFEHWSRKGEGRQVKPGPNINRWD
jgi:hypothetical protein